VVEPVAAEVALVQRHSQAPALRTIGVDVRTEEEMAEVMGGLRSTRRRGIGGSGCRGHIVPSNAAVCEALAEHQALRWTRSHPPLATVAPC